MGLSYLKLFYSFREEIELLSMEERGRLLTALLEYGETGALPEGRLTGNERFLFPVCRQRIDRDEESYNRQVEAGRINGVKGGRPRKTPRVILETEKTQDKDKGEEKEQEKEKDEGEGEVKVQDQGEDDGGFRPPTVREVVACCKKEAPSVDGERFWAFYQAVGWRAGGLPIVDWRAKLKEWERGNQTGGRLSHGISPPRDNPALNYAQRQYTDDDTARFVQRCESILDDPSLN